MPASGSSSTTTTTRELGWRRRVPLPAVHVVRRSSVFQTTRSAYKCVWSETCELIFVRRSSVFQTTRSAYKCVWSGELILVRRSSAFQTRFRSAYKWVPSQRLPREFRFKRAADFGNKRAFDTSTSSSRPPTTFRYQ